MTALDKALAVLRIYCAGQGDNEFLDKAEAELRRLHEENERLRALIRLDDAEWRDKEIWPCVGDAYQAWLVQVYLPVPLSAADKSPEAALQRALAQEDKT
jgi:hypothetical protein